MATPKLPIITEEMLQTVESHTSLDMVDILRIYDAARTVKAEAEKTMETLKDDLVVGLDAMSSLVKTDASSKLAFDLVVTSPGNVVQVVQLSELKTKLRAALSPLPETESAPILANLNQAIDQAIAKLSGDGSVGAERWRVTLQENHYNRLSTERLLSQGVTAAQIEAATEKSTSSFPTIKRIK